MASILDRYGIKEVADLTFYSIDANTGRPRTPVLYIDTAKVSTVESTAETSYAEGGKGNGRLLAWDFGKEITMTIEDAVFSPKSLSIMFGDGSAPVKDITVTLDTNKKALYKTLVLAKSSFDKATTDVAVANVINKALGNTDTIAALSSTVSAGDKVKWRTGNGTGTVTAAWTFSAAYTDVASGATKALTLTKGATASFAYTDTSLGTYEDDKVFVSFYLVPEHAFQVNVGPDTYPGTYYITADTYARSEADGTDQFFQIIIPKGKITSENTLTMEADGDPTVFNMNVEVLRADLQGEAKPVMMQLVQYDFKSDGSGGADNGASLDNRIITESTSD